MKSGGRWKVIWTETAKGDLFALKATEIRLIIRTAEKMLADDPHAATRHMKTLRPNP